MRQDFDVAPGTPVRFLGVDPRIPVTELADGKLRVGAIGRVIELNTTRWFERIDEPGYWIAFPGIDYPISLAAGTEFEPTD